MIWANLAVIWDDLGVIQSDLRDIGGDLGYIVRRDLCDLGIGLQYSRDLVWSGGDLG